MMNDKPNWKTPISTIIQSATHRLYILLRLKSLGTTEKELVEIYNLYPQADLRLPLLVIIRQQGTEQQLVYSGCKREHVVPS